MELTEIFVLLLSLASFTCVTAKVVDFGPKLPDFIQEHPDKSWLVKFYAPWCYHCQQLEPVFVNVAEELHKNHDNLVVGRVDCTKNGPICERYEVQSYPTISYLNKDARVLYKGDRSVQSLVDFAVRLNGPDVKKLESCKILKHTADQHGLIVLSTEMNATSELNLQFESLASSMKSYYWFYKLNNKCQNFITEEGIYILKRHLDRPIKFRPNSTSTSEDLRKTMIEWVANNSFPVYGPLSSMNFKRVLDSDRLIAIAVLDEYKPAKKFSPSSSKFNQRFEKIAKKFAQLDDKLLFVRSSDLDLIESIAIGKVLVPNVMLLKPNLEYHLSIESTKDLNSKLDEIPLKLSDENIQALINLAKTENLTFHGGNSYLYTIIRYIFTQFNGFMNMYRASPLLASILIGLPSVIILFVIYTTCCYDGPTRADGPYEDDEISEDEERLLLNHAKQD